MTMRYDFPVLNAKIAVERSRFCGRVDLSWDYAAEHIHFAARRGQTPSEVCAALGSPRPGASWEEALWLVAEYAAVAMRAARELRPP